MNFSAVLLLVPTMAFGVTVEPLPSPPSNCVEVAIGSSAGELPKGGPFVNEKDFPKNGNPNCFCWVDLVSKADGEVVFTGDGPCNLPDPKFMAKGGVTNRVILLIGKRYTATAEGKLSVVRRSDVGIKVLVKSDKTVRIHWPVVFSFDPARAKRKQGRP